MIFAFKSKYLELIETDDAYIVEVDHSDKISSPVNNRILTGNALVDGAVVGVGVGVIGSLLVGKLLESKQQANNCHHRYRRDGGHGSAR